MAVLGITAGNIGSGGNPVYTTIPDFRQNITTSVTSQQSNPIPGGEYIRITASGNAVWVNIGQSPTASAGNTYLIPDGGTLDVGPTIEGDRVAVIDA